MRWSNSERELETRRARTHALPVLALVLGLGVGAPAAADDVNCEPGVIKLKAGSVVLRNTSIDGAETGGSSKSQTIVAFVELVAGVEDEDALCPRDESRLVGVELMTMNHVNGEPPAVLQAAPAKVLSGGDMARFEFVVLYDPRNCENGEGPVPKDQEGGVNQVKPGAFTYRAYATSDDNSGLDPGPNADSGTQDGDLTCKPSRTTAS
jgi:hypothetical protein